MNRKLLVLGMAILVLAGCATTNLPPVTSDQFAFQEDEKRLWEQAKEEQEQIAESGLVYEDKELSRYLNDIGRKLQPPEVYERIPFTFLVLKSPYSNAFAYPNGVIYIHTGMLARIENEAQLATLMAHEMTHATHRHGVRESRGLKNKTAALASVRAVVGQLPALGELTSVMGALGTRAAISGHSKALETEADTVGIGLVAKSGYDVREAPKLFEHLKKELEEENVKEPFFFGSHPRLEDRRLNYVAYLNQNPPASKSVVNAKTYRRKTAGVVMENAFLDLREGRFESALKGADKYLSIMPKSSAGYYLRGEIYRQRAQEEDLAEAVKAYKKAISLDKSYATAHKGLGLVYLKQGEKRMAKKAFNAYLKLSPKANDREYVRQYIAQCK